MKAALPAAAVAVFAGLAIVAAFGQWTEPGAILAFLSVLSFCQ